MKRRRLWAAMTILVVVPALLYPCGCGGERGGGISEIVLTPYVFTPFFAAYQPEPVDCRPTLTPYEVGSLARVNGMPAEGMDAVSARRLQEKAFAVETTSGGDLGESPGEGGPVFFLTVDTAAEAFLRVYAEVLERVEGAGLAPLLGDLVSSLLSTLERMRSGAGKETAKAASEDMGRLAVASRLLGGEGRVPPEMEERVTREVEKIVAAEGEAMSPVLGRTLDYSSFMLPAEYRGDPLLEGYYRAIVWLGEVSFHPGGGNGGGVGAGRASVREAVLLVASLHMSEVDGVSALACWDDIHSSLSFLRGTSCTLDVAAMTRLVGEVYGTSFPLGELEEERKLDTLASRMLEEAGEEGDPSFRLLGKRRDPVEEIMRFVSGGGDETDRLPKGLVLPAAFGSERAVRLLEEVYGVDDDSSCVQRSREIREKVTQAVCAAARDSLPDGFLEALGVLLQPCPVGYPSFMRSEAWQDRDLYLFLASLVRGRGEGAAGGDAAEEAQTLPAPEIPHDVYVEPRPRVFADLAALLDTMHRGLVERNLLENGQGEKMESLRQALRTCRDAAERELEGVNPSPEEAASLREAAGTILAACRGGGRGAGRVAAELFHDASYGDTVMAGIGNPVLCRAVVPLAGVLTLVEGRGWSYYEWITSRGAEEEMREWPSRVAQGSAPQPPAWTIGFLVH